MKQKLITVRAGFTNCYLLVNEGNCLLVDTGNSHQSKRLIKAITSLGIPISNLKAIFLTHSHFDHAGSAAEIKRMTKAKIIIHQNEESNLKDGFTRIPKGTSPFFKFISKMGREGPYEKKIGSYPVVEPDLVFTESLDLESLGFVGHLIHTPGHTAGSATLVTANEALVGDAMFNLNGNYYPGFANDEKLLHKTWEKLLALNVKWYYPAHGKRIGKSRLRDFAKRKGVIS